MPRNAEVDSLLLASLALEQALDLDLWDDVHGLIQERNLLIDAINASEDSFDLAEVMEVEERIERRLMQRRASLIDDFHREEISKRAAKAYRRADGPFCFDQAS